jgi:hypothetical protein
MKTRFLRRGSRGAAMVEAAVVIPVMVSFLAVIGLMKNGYDRKININQQTRSQALDYASHNCQSQAITFSETSQSIGTGINAGAASAGESTANGAQAAVGSPKASGIMAKADVKSPDLPVTGFRVGVKGRGLALMVHGENSVALCNEEPQDGSLGGAFSYAKGKLSSMF